MRENVRLRGAEGFRRRVLEAAESVLKRTGSVGPLEVFMQMGVLNPVHMDSWRKGLETHGVLEDWIQIGPEKKAMALEVFREWCAECGFRPVEARYVKRTPGGIAPLVITRSFAEEEEQFYRTHYAPSDLDPQKSKRLVEKLSKPPDLTVFEKVSEEGECSECGGELGKGSLLVMEGKRPYCLDCADLGHLLFLPSGDAAMSRRARKHSVLSAVVLRFSRSRNRYERRGLLVTEEGWARAEEQCAADAGERAVRREKDAGRRVVEDVRLAEGVERVIRELFPACPRAEAKSIASHTTVRSSGRVGRSAAGRELDSGAVERAVVAHIRHQHTEYDQLLMEGVERMEARARIRARVDEVLELWRKV